MEDLTFGEQVKIILGRKGMTIKRLAELIEAETGKKMSRQNLTQRLGRDNFQEQDMRMIAEILGCPFQLSILSGETQVPVRSVAAPENNAPEQTDAKENDTSERARDEEQKIQPEERDMTIGELYEIHRELSELEENVKAGEPVEEIKRELDRPKKESGAQTEEAAAEPEEKNRFEPVISHDDTEEDTEIGEVNTYTGREYQSNSVRMHPSRIGYVQVYDRRIHKWTDMTEWAFLGLQERKKALLGKAYEPPIYLD